MIETSKNEKNTNTEPSARGQRSEARNHSPGAPDGLEGYSVDGVMHVIDVGAQVEFINNEAKLKQALHLIKIHITESGQQSKDLHEAVQLLVDVARYHGHLES